MICEDRALALLSVAALARAAGEEVLEREIVGAIGDGYVREQVLVRVVRVYQEAAGRAERLGKAGNLGAETLVRARQAAAIAAELLPKPTPKEGP